MNLQPILDKNLPHAYMELEFDKLGIARKFLFSSLVQKEKWKLNQEIFC